MNESEGLRIGGLDMEQEEGGREGGATAMAMLGMVLQIFWNHTNFSMLKPC